MSSKSQNRPIAIDLFAGVGGLSLGFEQAGFDVVAAVEIDPIHAAGHELNFPRCAVICRDVRKLSGREIRDSARIGNQTIDVLFGGPPCQGFGLTTYSLQNHLRTQIEGVQIEIDEVYVGIGKTGEQYIIPVQAKGGNDRLGRVQLQQDIALCKQRFSSLTCRAVAAQFMDSDAIAMFELVVQDDKVRIVDEKHYKLVPASEISAEDLAAMRSRNG